MKFKKILAAAVSAAMAVGCMAYMPQTEIFEPMTVEAGSYSDLVYAISDKTVTITNCSSTVTSVVIPSEINGYIVDCIGSNAFADCGSLSSITIPDSVKTIGAYAFGGCVSLSNVTIPDSVTSIGENAFGGCVSLSNVTIPGSVESIGYEAFYNCKSLSKVTILDGVTRIGADAFKKCTSLSSVTIPDSVTSIGRDAFYNTAIVNNQTTNVKYVDTWAVDSEGYDNEIKEGTTGIADRAFYSSYYFDEPLKIPDGVLYIGDSAFEDSCIYYSITIPDSVKTIGAYAFYKCNETYSTTFNETTSIIIGDGVTSIGEHAFADYDSLSSVTIPDSVTSIGEFAFSSCDSLSSITIENPNCQIGIDALGGSDVTICGYENSTAQKYADTYGKAFVSLGEAPTITTSNDSSQGDSNGDGKVSVRDCAFIASALAKNEGDTLPSSADFNNDGKVNVRDAAAIAKALAKGEI